MSIRPRIHVLYEHDACRNPHGCSYIRLLYPLSTSALIKKYEITASSALPSDSVDVLIIERLWRALPSESTFSEILDYRKSTRCALIYTLDDNLLDLFEDTPQFIYPKKIIRRFIRMADTIVTSTELLAARIAGLNPRTITIKNTLNREFLSSANEHRPPSEIFTLGYMGSYTHLEDLTLVAPAINRFLKKHRKRALLQIIGISDKEQLLKNLFPDVTLSFLHPGENHQYPDFMHWFSTQLSWDAAIAPLRRSTFADCKSDLKFLDYTACGCPGLYSDAPSFNRSVVHGETGMLCGESPDDWTNALDQLFENQVLRSQLYQNARKAVMASRLNEHVQNDWVFAIDSAMSHRSSPRSA